tara:strand:+ start:631 stop:804 length:174 start_codon:yes stop_codon:yes gene_type:complete
MKTIKLSNKNFELFKKFVNIWIDERQDMMDCIHDPDVLNDFAYHVMFDVQKAIKRVK